jgi:hypothetical protein
MKKTRSRKSRDTVPLTPVYMYRSLMADMIRRMLETIGELADMEESMNVRQFNWFESDLCILGPLTSAQIAAFEMLKVSGMLCSRHSTSVHVGGAEVFCPGQGEREVQRHSR